MVDITYRIAAGPHEADRLPSDGTEARRRLERGNREFVELVARHGQASGARSSRVIWLDPRDLGVGEIAGPPVQRPFAAVLACADARVPTELVFGQAVNSLFVVRIAGNVLGAECLGSLDYAVDHFADMLRLVVVLAHGECGAVTTAVDSYLAPARYLTVATSHPLRAIVDRLIAVRGAARILETAFGAAVSHHSGYRATLIDLAVIVNAALAAYSLQGELRARRAMDLRVVYGVYDLASRYVRRALPAPGDDGDLGLEEPPTDLEAFARLGARLAEREHVRRLLAGGDG
jgi:carbonic anhydrase